MPASLPLRTTGRWWIGYWKKQSSTSLTGRSTSITTTVSVMTRDTGSSGFMRSLSAKHSAGWSCRGAIHCATPAGSHRYPCGWTSVVPAAKVPGCDSSIACEACHDHQSSRIHDWFRRRRRGGTDAAPRMVGHRCDGRRRRRRRPRGPERRAAARGSGAARAGAGGSRPGRRQDPHLFGRARPAGGRRTDHRQRLRTTDRRGEPQRSRAGGRAAAATQASGHRAGPRRRTRAEGGLAAVAAQSVPATVARDDAVDVHARRNGQGESAACDRGLDQARECAFRRVDVRVPEGAGRKRRDDRPRLRHERQLRHVGARRLGADDGVRRGLHPGATQPQAGDLQGPGREPAHPRRHGTPSQGRRAPEAGGDRHQGRRRRRRGAHGRWQAIPGQRRDLCAAILDAAARAIRPVARRGATARGRDAAAPDDHAGRAALEAAVLGTGRTPAHDVDRQPDRARVRHLRRQRPTTRSRACS